jgi:hypothetical protein
LLIYLVLGMCVYLGYAALRPAAAPTPRPVLRIDPSILQTRQQQREKELGRTLTEAERQELVEAQIGEEVLLAEARERGLDQFDRYIRMRLLYLMYASIDKQVPAATPEQLRAYFTANPERYRRGTSVTLEQVRFDPGSGQLSGDPQDILKALQNGQDFKHLGDASSAEQAIARATAEDLAKQYGSRFAGRIQDMPVGEWAGPIPSRQGIHFVRVTQVHPPGMPEFDAVADRVREDYNKKAQEHYRAQRTAMIREQYRIVMEGS